MTAAIAVDTFNRVRTGITRIFRSHYRQRPFISIERERKARRTKAQKKIVRDLDYYARLEGLEVVSFDVVTDDRFVLKLFRVIDPNEPIQIRKNRYPILLIHGLLQSAGAFCVNDESSLAFYLTKSGYDVWLGNNRCGFDHRHLDYSYNDPRMWDWDVREMGTLDLPAFVDHVLHVTGYKKIALACHSQGTTQTFLALSRSHTPDFGKKISVFCALAPAVYAGPLVDRRFFKFIRYIPSWMYRICFGVHAFIPSMISLRKIIPKSWLAYFSYAMFHYLFHWSDERWEKALSGRMFQFSPVYVSAESMRWWLGRNGFASRRCILPDSEEPWFDDRCPPFALWIAGQDLLVDGLRLITRLETLEPHVALLRKDVISEYEHLDVLWAVDSVDHIAKGVKEVVWSTAFERENCRCPTGCEDL
ncbi:Alpha/Beta hydrolase protein [Lipomyces oligophaga]|uniref:Alpha/Beta hydrolase protein n=1 Tax=Lipomyces oligophaga TaxID=45792 RepID=UPI0034CD81B9